MALPDFSPVFPGLLGPNMLPNKYSGLSLPTTNFPWPNMPQQTISRAQFAAKNRHMNGIAIVTTQRPQGMEVLPTCLSLFPRDTRLLSSFSSTHDKGVVDYREGVPISPLKKRSNEVFSQGPQPISSSCPLPKVSESRNLCR